MFNKMISFQQTHVDSWKWWTFIIGMNFHHSDKYYFNDGFPLTLSIFIKILHSYLNKTSLLKKGNFIIIANHHQNFYEFQYNDKFSSQWYIFIAVINLHHNDEFVLQYWNSIRKKRRLPRVISYQLIIMMTYFSLW